MPLGGEDVVGFLFCLSETSLISHSTPEKARDRLQFQKSPDLFISSIHLVHLDVPDGCTWPPAANPNRTSQALDRQRASGQNGLLPLRGACPVHLLVDPLEPP